MWYSETFGTIKTPRGITVNGIQHPASIFRKWTKPELLAIGIAPARVDVPDSRYYNTGRESYSFTDGEWVISYDSTEKDVEQLKEQLISKINAHVGSLLSSSDWRVIRRQTVVLLCLMNGVHTVTKCALTAIPLSLE